MRPGALVAVTTDDPLRFVSESHRVWDKGGSVLPVDHRLTHTEIESLLSRMRPEMLISGDATQNLEGGVEVDPAVALVLATSGTTGAPKGVEIGRDALLFSMRATASHLGVDSTDRWLCCLPPAHIAGLKTLLGPMGGARAPVVVAAGDLDAIAADREATLVSLVPTQMMRLFDRDADLSRFKAVLVGGGPIPDRLMETASDRSVRVVRTYGMTETCGGCIYDGVPLAGAEMRVDDNGVIHLRGPMLFYRYRSEPELTTSVLSRGWFRTGDVGSVDDGVLSVVGRADEIIVTGGHNVSPVEVESTIAEHPDVIDCAVTGVPDAEWGHRVVALVVVADGRTAPDIRSWCEDRLARYKLPKQVIAVQAIPRSSTGKIIRSKLPVIAAADLGM